MEQCFTGAQSGANSQTLSLMGNIVEAVVMVHYLEDRVARGGVPIVFDLPGATDFFDVKGDKCDQFASFIKLRNPHVDQNLIDSFCRQRKIRDGDKGMVPDIITHAGALREFYEVKPASASGRSAGVQKLRNFCELSAGHGLPYCDDTGPDPLASPRGHEYNPNYRKVFWRGQYFGIPAQVSLRFERDSESLLLYKFCVEVTSQTVTEAVLVLALKAAIVAVVYTRGAALGILVPSAAGFYLFLRSPLQASVGNRGSNQTADVRYVQRLLNQWRAPRNLAALKVDGALGPETFNAIVLFQQQETPVWVDGVIEPGRNTIQVLETLFLTSIDQGYDGAIFDDNARRVWLDDVSYGIALLAPGNQDPPPAPGETDVLPIDPASVVQGNLQEILDLLHDGDFGPDL